MVIGGRTGNAAEQLVVVEAGEHVLQLAERTEPVGAQPGADDRLRQDGRRPLDGVDFRQQRGVDQAGLLKQALVVPHRVVLLELVADGVVLEGE